MVEYTPIGDLIKKLQPPEREVFREIAARRRELLLAELLPYFKQHPPEPQGREGRSLANHPDNPARASRPAGTNVVRLVPDHLDKG
jgi:hypothetical protein